MWSTLPLYGVASYFEHQLIVSQAGHTWLQILMIGLMFPWAFFWYRLGEQNRLRFYQLQKEILETRNQARTPMQNDYFVSKSSPEWPLNTHLNSHSANNAESSPYVQHH
jgi:hypothetical protein